MSSTLFTDFDTFREIPEITCFYETIETCCKQLSTLSLSPHAAQPFYRLLFARNLPGQEAYNEQEQKNSQDVYQQLTFKVFGSGFNFELTPDLVCDMNRQLRQNMPSKTRTPPGVIRTHNIVLKSAVDHNIDIPVMAGKYCQQELERLCTTTSNLLAHRTSEQARFEAVVYAALFHYCFGVIHPFGDANGRTARAIEAYILMAGGVPLIACNLLTNLYNHNRAEMQTRFWQSRQHQDTFPVEYIEYAIRGFTHLLKQVTEKALELSKNTPAGIETHKIPVYETAH